MTAYRKFWEDIEAIFDPEVPVQDAALFAERDPAYNPLVYLERVLQRSTGPHRRYLLTGTVGNGKTSELNHFAAKLSQHRMIVQIDLWRHFQASIGDTKAFTRVEPWELLGLLGLAIFRAGADYFNHKWKGETHALQRALDALRKADQGDGPAIDVPSLARGVAIAVSGVAGGVTGGPAAALAGSQAARAGLKVLDAAISSTDWSWKIGEGKRTRSDQDVRQVLSAVNAMIMALQGDYDRRLLLLVDGLDRAGPERNRALFIDSGLLGELVCDAVWMAPGGLRRLDNDLRGFEIRELCNVPVLDREDPKHAGEKGLEFFRSLVDKRVAQVRTPSSPPDPFPVPQVDRLAFYSGGLGRDFVRMIRMAAGEILYTEGNALTPNIVEITLREARRIKEAQINSAEIELLERLMLDPSHKLPPGDLAANLLAQQRLLPYPNDTTWYYPHPLLTLALLRPRCGSAG